MLFRFNDGSLSSAALDRIYNLSKMLPYDERKAVIQLGLLNRYIILIKLEQQKILSLTRRDNKTIKDSPKTLQTVKGALTEYNSLLTRLGVAIDEQSSVLKPLKKWETQWSGKIDDMRVLWTSYSNGITGLESLVKGLETYQAELELARLKKAQLEQAQQAETAARESAWSWWPYLLSLVAMFLAGAYLLRKR